MLEYHLGEMRSKDGAALRYEVEAKSLEHALKISERISLTETYGKLKEKFPGEYVAVYFRYCLKKEILPYVRQACVVEWQRRNGKQIPEGKGRVSVGNEALFEMLKAEWTFRDVAIEPGYYGMDPAAGVLNTLKRAKSAVREGVETLAHRASRLPAVSGIEKGFIACHYAEGFDRSKRNDICWYEKSGIEPGRVLVYFSCVDNYDGKPIKRSMIRDLEEEGFRWVALKPNIIERQGNSYWRPAKIPAGNLLGRVGDRPVERWIVEAGNCLINDVHYWRSFYDDFNIKVNCVTEEGFARNIAQNIAFGIRGKRPGVFVGKQRSEIYSISSYEVGYHPNDVFFIWSPRTAGYLKDNQRYIGSAVVSGYPYDTAMEKRQASGKIRPAGAEFTVALFDNVCFRFNPYSRSEMAALYRSMLEWVIGDGRIGLIIKSKKPAVLASIPEVLPLLEKAIATGRCVRMENEWGRLPTDAASAADISVGAGISSAVIESVIAGYRGVHYDMTRLRSHEFYSWGYGRLVFDDLGKMMEALKKFASGTDEGIGDWSKYVDKLDPYHDGRGGARMGIYMKDLLDSIDSGATRDEAIGHADRSFMDKWGNDKVIKMERING